MLDSSGRKMFAWITVRNAQMIGFHLSTVDWLLKITETSA